MPAVTARSGKRLIDLLLGSLLALLALPLVLLLAGIQAAQLRCWPFFIQERIGTGGRHQHFPKVRSLPKSTPAYALKTTTELGATGLARIMRATHLDELPQLLLVPLGRLSLVGPRPKMPQRFEPACDLYSAARVTVPQGCTGLWQISVDRDGLPQDSPQYDLFYLRHASNRMDLWILWRTFGFMLRFLPPITLEDVPRSLFGSGFVPAADRPALPIVPTGLARPAGAARPDERAVSCLAELLCATCGSSDERPALAS